jgi:hypothetical protein
MDSRLEPIKPLAIPVADSFAVFARISLASMLIRVKQKDPPPALHSAIS